MFKSLINNPYFNALSNIRSLLDPDQKKKGLGMVALLLINAFFDLISLAAIMAVINSALKSPSLVANNFVAPSGQSSIESWLNIILRNLYDFFGSGGLMEFLFTLSFVLLFILIIKNLVSMGITYIQTKYAFDIALRLNMKMFKYYYDKGFLFIRETSSGKNVYKVIDIPLKFGSNYLNPVFTFTTELVVLTLLVLLLVIAQPMAVLLLAIVILPYFILVYLFTKNKVKSIGAKRNKVAPLNYSRLFESMNAYVDIKLANLENSFLKKYHESQARVNQMDILYQGIYQRIHQSTNDIIFGLGLLTIFSYAYFTQAGTNEVVSIITFFGVAAYKFLPGLNRMMNAMLNVKNASYVIGELKEINRTSLHPFAEVGAMVFESEVELRNVSYRYPDSKAPVLDGLSMVIRKGETLGIVGSSGSGKTTLLRLLLRLIKQDNGEILVDKIALEGNLHDASFQKMIGYVEQDVFIWNGTLRENIAFGQDSADEDKLNAAIQNSMLSELVKNHPLGKDMPLGEVGVKLSGGQKQRVGIARALYKDASILLFDEATSALDNETERSVLESIHHLSDLGKTIVIVAHRNSTLKKCDNILELSGGKILRELKYEDLMKDKILMEG